MTKVISAAMAVALPFTDTQITESINNLPSQFGQLAAEGMFPAEGMTGNIVEIDIVDGVISALPVTDPEAPSTVSRKDGQKALYFKVPNISHLDQIKANDIRGMLEKSGRSRNPATLASEFNKRLERLRKKHDITLELMRTSALKGVLIDGAGAEIYNFFEAFEITKKVVFFDLDNAEADILGKCQEINEHIEGKLSDEVMTHVECRVSTQFFSKLIRHPNVEKYWLQHQHALQIANVATFGDGQYRPRTFQFGNVLFKEYSASVPMWGGTSQRIIAAGKGHAYPAGTMDSHVTYAAPPVDIRVLDGSAASEGDLIHVTQEDLKHGAGVELKGQMNVLPLWRRPALLVEVSDAAA